MSPLILSLASLAAALPVIVGVHELGHVAGGLLGGYYVAAAGLGTGRRFLRLRLGPRFNLFVGPWLLGGGATVAFPTRAAMPRRAAVAYHYGGIVAQLVLQAVLHGIYWRWPEARAALLPALGLNAVTLMTNLVPYRLRLRGWAVASDGAQVWAALRGEAALSVVPRGGLPLGAWDRIEARLGTPVGRYVLQVCRVLAEGGSPADLATLGPPPEGTPALYREQVRTAIAGGAAPAPRPSA